MPKRHWLLKSEPDVYSIDDLSRDGRTGWEGVRNYQARNFLREMKVGDLALFYHSNAEPPGVAGVCEVVREAFADPTQFDSKSPYHDPGAKPEEPRWSQVEVAFVEKLPSFVPLATIAAEPALEGMEVRRKGSRLSVHAVTAEHFARVRALGRKKAR